MLTKLEQRIIEAGYSFVDNVWFAAFYADEPTKVKVYSKLEGDQARELYLSNDGERIETYTNVTDEELDWLTERSN